MNLKRFAFIAALAIAALLPAASRAQNAAATNGYPENRLGLLQPSWKLMNTMVWSREEHELGRIKDLIVDWNSGRILCALVTPANLYGPTNYFVAVPVKCFVSADHDRAVLDVANTNLLRAPRFQTNGWASADLGKSLKDSFGYFEQPVAWDEKADLAKQFTKLNSLTGLPVNSRTGADLGKLADVMLDVPEGRILFALVSYYGWDANLHAAPPSALTLNRSGQGFRFETEPATAVQTATNPNAFLFTEMADPDWAAANYRAYGKDLVLAKPAVR